MNISLSKTQLRFTGPGGSLRVPNNDEVCRRLAMLIEGQCEGLGPAKAAQKYDFSRQRYYQILAAFYAEGAEGLLLQSPGPKTDYRRTDQVVRLVIRCRFLDPDCSPAVIAQKIRQQSHTIGQRSIERIIADYGLQKKLYALNPANPPQFVQTQRTRKKQRSVPADPKSLERQVRQTLADKISGNQIGIWLLLPEHLRLGTWDLMRSWSGLPTDRVEPRLALHLVNEAAMCLCSYRQRRTLSQKGFELANGLPFVPTDLAIHNLLQSHTVQQAQQLQIALGKLRRAGGHFEGTLLALDPHRMTSYSQRQMRRHRFSSEAKPAKMAQTFFLLDCHTGQPVCFSLSSSAQSVAQASPELLHVAAEILGAVPAATAKPLILADKEHYCQELCSTMRQEKVFDLLCAQPAYSPSIKRWSQVPAAQFTEHWPGYATARQPYHFKAEPEALYHEYVQRSGLRQQDYHYQGFLGTAELARVPTLTKDYPQRWHVEEFFKFNQALGWHRAGTLNLNIRYGHLSMVLVAQGAIHQLRQRLGLPFAQWDATHLARNLFEGLEGDVRVEKQTIVVTLYNPPNAALLQSHYEHLPENLAREGVNPEIPWLYNFKLDFRFK
jgi:hypothetical protein